MIAMAANPPPDPFALKFIRFILIVSFFGPIMAILAWAFLSGPIIVLIEVFNSYSI